MKHRFGRSLRIFLVVLSAAGFYRLTVVPFVEPRIHEVTTSLEPTAEETAAIRARSNRRLASMGDVFPEGSWERDDPIMLESRQMRLLFKQYHSLPDGRVNLVPCTLVMLPERKSDGSISAARTVVMRAPQGAVLEFDEPLDLRQGKLAKLIGGSLRGQITIRGTPSSPGAQDDLEIVTRDVELEDTVIHTNETVQFRYGHSRGSGRSLIVKLLPRAGEAGQGPNIGGVESLVLERDVQMRLEGTASRFMPGAKEADVTETTESQTPVLISCRGSLRIDVSSNVLSFEDHVDVTRSDAAGATDQLTCDMLSILFGKREQKIEAPENKLSTGSFQPLEIEAKGSPVVARSTASGLDARAQRLGYEIGTRRILLDGDEPVLLITPSGEMEARSIDYVPGPPGSPGSLMAVGPGHLRWAQENGSSPPQKVTAHWQKWLRIRPDGSDHVASLAGSAEITIQQRGRLAASEIHLWLESGGTKARAIEPNSSVSSAVPSLDGIRPARMLARGVVEIDVEQLAARTDRLELWFRNTEQPLPQSVSVNPVAVSKVNSVQASPATRPLQATPAEPRIDAGRMMVTGGLVRGLIKITPEGGELDEISLEGQVHLVEEQNGSAQEPPLDIRGDQLQLTNATRFDARAVVSGRPAIVSGRGLDLHGPLVEFDRGRNRISVDGAGRLTLPMAADSSGLESFHFSNSPAVQSAQSSTKNTKPGKLEVTWNGRMDFDGMRARFNDKVVTRSGNAVLNAGSLDVYFTRPIEFSGSRPQSGQGANDVAKIACGGGVRIDSRSVPENPSPSLDSLVVRDLFIDRVSGAITGSGPGRLSSVRFGQAPSMPAPGTIQSASTSSEPKTARPDELTYLGVDFQKGMTGNIQRHSLDFHQRVEAIWGPVATWEDILDPHAPQGLSPRAVLVTSDLLSIGQVPAAPGVARASIELSAGGNVLVEGDSFTARAARLSWSEAKDLLIFQGDGRSDAQLYRQLRPGAPTSSASAGKIFYWRSLNRVDVDDARYLDLDQLGGSSSNPSILGSPAPQSVPGT